VVQGVSKRAQKAAAEPDFGSASQEALAAVRNAKSMRASLVIQAATQPIHPRASSHTSMHSVSSSATSAVRDDDRPSGQKKQKTAHDPPAEDNPEERPSQDSSSVRPQDLGNKFDAVASLRERAVTSLGESWQSASTETLPWGETESVPKKQRMMSAAVLTSLCSYVASSLNVRVLA
jgi:hypothetical protein